jgi:hypothetical protein
MANKLVLKLKSPVNLTVFLKRFSPISSGLLLEIYPDCITAKSHTEDKSVIKYSRMPLVDVLEGEVKDLVKVGIHELKKVIDALKYFKETDEIHLEVKYEEVANEKIATELLFRSSSLKIKIITADTQLFNYISPEFFKKIKEAVTSERIMDFPFPKEAFGRVGELCKIDAGDDLLSILINEGNVSVKSKSFEYTVCDAPQGADTDFTFYNKYFNFIEPEISNFLVGNVRMMATSMESDTIIVIGRVG